MQGACYRSTQVRPFFVLLCRMLDRLFYLTAAGYPAGHLASIALCSCKPSPLTQQTRAASLKIQHQCILYASQVFTARELCTKAGVAYIACDGAMHIRHIQSLQRPLLDNLTHESMLCDRGLAGSLVHWIAVRLSAFVDYPQRN